VGIDALPAGLHAADTNFLYLRLRVAANPIAGPRLLPDAWGYELNLDGSGNTYQFLFVVTGIGNQDQVAVYRHSSTAAPGDPADPSDLPPAFTYPFATHAQVRTANSTVGGGTDYFIDLALPWTDLATLGVHANTTVAIWAGSSSVANALNGDLACFAGAGGRLGGIAVGTTTPDPMFSGGPGGPPPPDGGTGTGTGPRTLEGGPGCSMAGDRGVGGTLMLFALLWIGLGWRISAATRRP
jgi:hypothetical protein